MDWKEFQENTKAMVNVAAQKLNALGDLAGLHLHLRNLENQQRELYEALGKTAYRHFTTDDSGVEAITKYVEAITLNEREIIKTRKLIQKAQQKEDHTNAQQ